jgi:uncharacterized protein (UPF0276 family)
VSPGFSRNDACRPRPVSANAGIGLRLPHHRWLLEHRPAVNWLEVHPENYMTAGARSAQFERIADDYPLSLHAVGLSLGSVGGPDPVLGQLVRRTGCGVLLDINNIYVSALNFGTDPYLQLQEYLARIPHSSIGELHLAGHATVIGADGQQRHIDDHGSGVCGQVWQLFRTTIKVLGPRPTLIEWDTRLPSFEVLQGEAGVAQWILKESAPAEPLYAIAR